mgnify:CR=1 FL=1
MLKTSIIPTDCNAPITAKDNITKKRIENSKLLDKLLAKNENVILVKREKYLKEVFHLYHINVNKRDSLQKFLIKNDIDAKVHYPIPIHLQKAAKFLKYKKIAQPLNPVYK